MNLIQSSVKMGNKKKRKIVVIFDEDQYPYNLCKNELKVIIDGTIYDFGRNSLLSGGEVSCYNEDGEDRVEITEGPWEIIDWPDDFPEDLKEETLNEINRVIPWGCCGGCL